MIYFRQTISTTEVFHVKTPRPGFSFLPLVIFEIIHASFSGQISLFPTID